MCVREVWEQHVSHRKHSDCADRENAPPHTAKFLMIIMMLSINVVVDRIASAPTCSSAVSMLRAAVFALFFFRSAALRDAIKTSGTPVLTLPSLPTLSRSPRLDDSVEPSFP